MRTSMLLTVGLAAAALAACGDQTREAESKTPVAEAEVQTDLPAAAVSDQTLQQSADQAAAQASTPAPGTTGTPSTAPAAGTNPAAPTQ